VIATGQTHSVREFVEKAFKVIGKTITWEGSGENEIGKTEEGRVVVRINPRYYRPTEVMTIHWCHTCTNALLEIQVDILLGNAEKAKRVLSMKH